MRARLKNSTKLEQTGTNRDKINGTWDKMVQNRGKIGTNWDEPVNQIVKVGF